MTPCKPCCIRWVAVKTTLVDVGLAPGMLEHDQIPTASGRHDRAHAGIASVVGDLQFDASKTMLRDTTLHLALNRSRT